MTIHRSGETNGREAWPNTLWPQKGNVAKATEGTWPWKATKEMWPKATGLWPRKPRKECGLGWPPKGNAAKHSLATEGMWSRRPHVGMWQNIWPRKKRGGTLGHGRGMWPWRPQKGNVAEYP